jgi:hypothetical protein
LASLYTTVDEAKGYAAADAVDILVPEVNCLEGKAGPDNEPHERGRRPSLARCDALRPRGGRCRWPRRCHGRRGNARADLRHDGGPYDRPRRLLGGPTPGHDEERDEDDDAT